ncbi:hypothetical protein [Leptospira santarosai]|uniref:hypothetical protein n=1 Tax=Leptospira santarosai TaxID=28183 RepID=UPI00138ED5EB|nr:hypothetical protein [Leptospira santarosai]
MALKKLKRENYKKVFPPYFVTHLLKDLRKRKERYLKGSQVQNEISWTLCLKGNLRKIELFYKKKRNSEEGINRLWSACIISQKEKLIKLHDEIYSWGQVEYQSLIRMNNGDFHKELGPLWVLVLNKQKIKLKSIKPNLLLNDLGYRFVDIQKVKLKNQIKKQKDQDSDWQMSFLAQIQKLRNRHQGLWARFFRKQELKIKKKFKEAPY